MTSKSQDFQSPIRVSSRIKTSSTKFNNDEFITFPVKRSPLKSPESSQQTSKKSTLDEKTSATTPSRKVLPTVKFKNYSPSHPIKQAQDDMNLNRRITAFTSAKSEAPANYVVNNLNNLSQTQIIRSPAKKPKIERTFGNQDTTLDNKQNQIQSSLYEQCRYWSLAKLNRLKAMEKAPNITKEVSESRLPPPVPWENTEGLKHPRIAKPLSSEERNSLSTIGGETNAINLESHTAVWKSVRSKWLNQIRKDDMRYANSFAILDAKSFIKPSPSMISAEGFNTSTTVN